VQRPLFTYLIEIALAVVSVGVVATALFGLSKLPHPYSALFMALLGLGVTATALYLLVAKILPVNSRRDRRSPRQGSPVGVDRYGLPLGPAGRGDMEVTRGSGSTPPFKND
jgi:hypothetical protein